MSEKIYIWRIINGLTMEDSCSSFYNTEKEESNNDHEKEIAIKNLTYQNERLQEMNNQLQSSLDAVKSQLKEALTYKNSISSIGQQIETLQDKLSETTEENKKLNKRIQTLTSQKEENEKNYKDEVTKVTTQLNNTLQTMQKLKDKNLRYRKEREDIISELSKKQELNEAVGTELQKLQKKKKRILEKYNEVNSSNQQMKVAIAESERTIQSITAENKLLKQEIDDLKLQIGTQQALQGGNSTAITRLNDELKIKTESISALEETIKSQSHEIEGLIGQRERLIALLQKLHCAMCKNETVTANLKQDLDSMKIKCSQMNTKQLKIVPEQNFSLANLTIPFTGALGEECEKIIKYEHYQPQQRLQIIFNEAEKKISELSTSLQQFQENSAKLEESAKTNEEKATINAEMMAATMKDLKNLASNETQFSRTAGIKDDRNFISFVAQKCSEVDPIIKSISVDNPKYIPSYFFFTDDTEQRIQTLQRLLSPSDETFSLFMTQFMINMQLRRQLAKATAAADDLLQTQTVIQQVGVQRIEEIPNLVDDLKLQIDKLTNARLSLRKSLKQSQAALVQQNKYDTDSQISFERAQLQVDTLKNENEILEVKVNVLETDLKNKEAEIKSLTKQLSDAIVKSTSERGSELEYEIQQKQQTIDSLTEQVSSLKAAVEGAASIQARALKKQEVAHRRDLEEFNSQLAQVVEESEKRVNKSKKMIRALKASHQQEIEKMKNDYDASKNALEQSNAILVAKGKEAMESAQKLINSLSESEKEIQKLVSENAKLSATQKSLEVQLAAAKDRNIKEKQNAQNQVAAQQLAIESRIQERASQIKADYNEQKKALFASVIKTIGAVYGVDQQTFDEQTLEQLMVQAQQDLEKLKMFQTSPCCMLEH